MDLTQLANLGEFIGGIAVLVTLVYLAVQVRSQTREGRHATIVSLTQQYNDWMTSVSESKEIAALWVRGLEDYESFDAPEVAQWGALMNRFFRFTEALYLQRLDGRCDPRIWNGVYQNLCEGLAYPGTRAWWERRRTWYSDEFVALMEISFAEAGAPSMYPEARS